MSESRALWKKKFVEFEVSKAHDFFNKQIDKIGVNRGLALYLAYKRMSEDDKALFRKGLENDWKEHRKFDEPVEDIVDAEVVEDGE